MKNILLKIICVFTLALGLNTSTKAQLVYIPDPAFRNYLNFNFSSCMVGDSIDSTCPAVLNAKEINVSNSGISDLSGIEVFVNDTVLKCSSNSLSSLPLLPNSITELYCQFNQITSLGPLPSNLRILTCSSNIISNISALPGNLTDLQSYNNLLTTLPAIPNSLKYLNCGTNQLNNLPSLSSSLEYLYCGNNQLTSLPALPNTLKGIHCFNNNLTQLPTLPSSLNTIDFQNNLITIIPALPSGLNYLSFRNNLVSFLPPLPSSLISIVCSYNQITTLPILPNSLNFLTCPNNLLTSLPLLPPFLTQLNCDSNQISTLPEIPDSLKYISIIGNPISCFPKMKFVQSFLYSGTLINCRPPNLVILGAQPPLSSLPICNFFNSNGCDLFWNIEGVSFFDSDTNCILGTNDHVLKNLKLNLFKNGTLNQITFSDTIGYYNFDTFAFDFYKTELERSGLPFEVFCPSSGFYLDTISLVDSIKFNRDFSLKCKGIDLAATSISSFALIPASVRKIKIGAGDYSNSFGAHCATGVSGTVTITITGSCNYISPAAGALTPNSVVGNVLNYIVSDFGTLSFDSSFNFYILIDTNAILGSQICFNVSISTKALEVNYYNNFLTQCFSVVGSYDPNDKSVYPASTLDISGDRWLTYTIRFQNTGTADAQHIYITDTLDLSLDFSTIALLSYSHQPILNFESSGILKFQYPNINLPDSNTNEPASHGYVQYKIRAKDSLTIGGIIENTANIFFDFNSPVITNTTNNTIINCSIPPTIITASICNGEAFYINGALYYIEGIYEQKLITRFGCDSIIELHLTVSSILNTASQSSEFLQTTAIGSAYQWINCATNISISGATNSTYQPTQSGEYAVVVTYGTCIDTSNCYKINLISSEVIFQTWYNSTSNQIQLNIENLQGNNGLLRLMDISGRIIFQKQIENISAGNLDLEIPAKGMNAGIYLVNLITELDNISGESGEVLGRFSGVGFQVNVDDLIVSVAKELDYIKKGHFFFNFS